MKASQIIIIALISIFFISCVTTAQESNEIIIISESGEELKVTEGKITLPENRKKTTGNTIEITYQVLKSKSNNPKPPVFLLAGGPGGSWLNTAHLEERFAEIKFYSQFSDVVIFDQRGAGRSVPNLECGTIFKSKKARDLSEQSLVKALNEMATECRDYWISQGVELLAYNTDESANDIDDLRKALGYEKVILVGGSYGSHLGLHYLRKYEEYVDCAVFYGIEGPNHTLDNPTALLNTIKRIAGETEKSEYFAKKLEGKGLLNIYKEVLEKIDKGEINELDKITAQFIFRYRVGDRNKLEVWPNNIISLHNRDFSFAKEVEKYLKEINPPSAMSNAMDFASWATAFRLKEIQDNPAVNLVGNINLVYFANQDIWATDILGEDFRTNVVSHKPVLLVHGTWDTSTPLENAYEVNHYLANSHLLKVIHGSHGAFYELTEEWEPMFEVLAGFMKEHSMEIPDSVILPLSFPVLYEEIQMEFWDEVIEGDLQGTKESLRKGAVIDMLDTRTKKTGRSGINWAAWHGHVEILEFLLENGADINYQNMSGYTPIHHAIENCKIKALRFLLSYGADVSIPSYNGKLPIETAHENCKKAIKIIENHEKN